MVHLTRRSLLTGGLLAGSLGFSGYAFGIEPAWRLIVTRYALVPPHWPPENMRSWDWPDRSGPRARCAGVASSQ